MSDAGQTGHRVRREAWLPLFAIGATGEPVSSNRRRVSRTASSNKASPAYPVASEHDRP